MTVDGEGPAAPPAARSPPCVGRPVPREGGQGQRGGAGLTAGARRQAVRAGVRGVVAPGAAAGAGARAGSLRPLPSGLSSSPPAGREAGPQALRVARGAVGPLWAGVSVRGSWAAGLAEASAGQTPLVGLGASGQWRSSVGTGEGFCSRQSRPQKKEGEPDSLGTRNRIGKS